MGLISTKESEPITCCHVIIFFSTQPETLASIFTMFLSSDHRQPWVSSVALAPITAATTTLEPCPLPLFRNCNILLNLALHGPAKHRESRTIRSPPLTPALTHLLYSSETCTVAATSLEKKKNHTATCHLVIAQSKWSKLVKYSNLVKDLSNKRC